MGQFSKKVKPWLKSVISQRKMLIRINASHINQAKAAMAIYELEQLLKTYSYNDDVLMAKFVRNHFEQIDMILPGTGSTCYEKKQREWGRLRRDAILLLEKSNIVTNNLKIQEYEMAF
jgi:hypothetical protein